MNTITRNPLIPSEAQFASIDVLEYIVGGGEWDLKEILAKAGVTWEERHPVMARVSKRLPKYLAVLESNQFSALLKDGKHEEAVALASDLFYGEGIDYSVERLAMRIGYPCEAKGDSLVINGTVFHLQRESWLEMGNQYSIRGQWSIASTEKIEYEHAVVNPTTNKIGFEVVSPK